MSARLRGQEATLRITVDGEVQDGSWFKVKDFTATPRADLVEESYLGETEDDLDFQHHGFDLSFSVDIEDRNVLDFLSDIIDREANHLAHPTVTVNVVYAFRNGDNPVAESYYQVFLKVDEQGFSGRKDYLSTSFSGKAKKRAVLSIG